MTVNPAIALSTYGLNLYILVFEAPTKTQKLILKNLDTLRAMVAHLDAEAIGSALQVINKLD